MTYPFSFACITIGFVGNLIHGINDCRQNSTFTASICTDKNNWLGVSIFMEISVKLERIDRTGMLIGEMFNINAVYRHFSSIGVSSELLLPFLRQSSSKSGKRNPSPQHDLGVEFEPIQETRSCQSPS